jgi:hypothetical protein
MLTDVLRGVPQRIVDHHRAPAGISSEWPLANILTCACKLGPCLHPQAKLSDKELSLAQQQQQVMDMHRELAELQALVRHAPGGSSSPGARRQGGSPGPGLLAGGSLVGDVERLRAEVHTLGMDLATARMELGERGGWRGLLLRLRL